MIAQFDNSYARELEGLWLKALPSRAEAPELIIFNQKLADELRLGTSGISNDQLAQIFSGNDLPDGAQPLAMAYAGHQFGHFQPQLGDGRAILLGEVVDLNGQRRDIQLKGAGRTPFSRGGDGRAALGPVLREYLVSEAMYALGVPATRALAAVLTGDSVWRETEFPGAVFTRVAASHIRIGTFQFFASRSDWASLKRLMDHAIARHDPQAAHAETPALAFLDCVANRQSKLIAKWTSVGFVHGVMNTDNMSISGETIDFGPCAFIDHYDPHALFSSIDQNGRYALSNQPKILQWNLARLAECLLPFIDADSDQAVAKATALIESIPALYEQQRLAALRPKLGLSQAHAGDGQLIDQLLDMMSRQTLDHTNTWRALAEMDDEAQFSALFEDSSAIKSWLEAWNLRLIEEGQTRGGAAKMMLLANPAIIPRNHRIEVAIQAAVSGDFTLFYSLNNALQNPYEGTAEQAPFRTPPLPEERVTKTFCGT